MKVPSKIYQHFYWNMEKIVRIIWENLEFWDSFLKIWGWSREQTGKFDIFGFSKIWQTDLLRFREKFEKNRKLFLLKNDCTKIYRLLIKFWKKL